MQDAGSPWLAYLQRVYRNAVPQLPFDVAMLEAFYLAMLPTSLCPHWGSPVKRLPRCNASDSICDGWLESSKPTPSTEEVDQRMHSQSYICTPVHLAKDAVRNRSPLAQMVLVQEPTRWPTPRDEWVEVVRIRPHLDPEGMGMGCWFYVARNPHGDSNS